MVHTMVVDVSMPLSIWPKVADVELQHGSQSQQDRLQSAAFHWSQSWSLLRIPWLIWLTLIMISSFYGSADASMRPVELNPGIVASLRPNTVQVQIWSTCNRVNTDANILNIIYIILCIVYVSGKTTLIHLLFHYNAYYYVITVHISNII